MSANVVHAANNHVPQFDMYDPAKIKSHPGIRTDLFPFNLSQVLVTDFFGGVSEVEVDLPVVGGGEVGTVESVSKVRRGRKKRTRGACSESTTLSHRKTDPTTSLTGLIGLMTMGGIAWWSGLR